MSARAGIILLQEGRLALIERHRSGMHYFSFPGGQVDKGETPGQAAIREAQEELGLQVTLNKLVARFRWQGAWQYYYLAEMTGGTFGTGTGLEMVHPLPERGTYQPVWMPVTRLLAEPVLPSGLAALVARSVQEGWPEGPVEIPESGA